MQDIRDSAAKFVVKDFRPFYAIEGNGLKDLIHAAIQLAKRYPNMRISDLENALPSRNTLTTHVNSLAEKGKEVVTKLLRNAIDISGGFGVTSDMYDEKYNSTSILGVTIHILNPTKSSLTLERCTIDAREITALSVTDAVIKNTILKIFSEYGLSEDEVKQFMCIVTDRGSNMRLAVADWENEACLAHLLNNVFGIMLNVNSVKTIITAATSLVKYVKTAHINSHLQNRLKLYVETRWNTAYDMLKSIIDNYQDVYEMLQAKEQAISTKRDLLSKLTNLPINDLRAMCDFFVFFKNATLETEGDKNVTLHKVWPVLRELKKKLQPSQYDAEIVEQMKDAGRTYTQKPDNIKFFSASMRHKVAMFLHPQMKKMPFAEYYGKI